MVTVYRFGCPEVAFGFDDAETTVKERKISHPVLFDPGDAYLKSLAPGPARYPAVYLVGKDGKVAWESTTDRKDFAEACEAEIGKALESSAAAKDAGAPSGPR